MLKITYAYIHQLQPTDWKHLLDSLPQKEQQTILQIKSFKNQVQKTIARILLRKELMNIGYDQTILEKIKKNNSGKPFIDGSIFFNISHSNDIVMLALCDQGDIGIDTEQIRYVNTNGFKIYFSDEEWDDIINSPTQNVTLLQKWTAREAFLKAMGIGFAEGVDDITLNYSTKKASSKNAADHYFDYVNISPDCITAYSCEKELHPTTIECVNF